MTIRLRAIALIGLFLGVIFFQYSYDATRPVFSGAAAAGGISPSTVRLVDMGFHATLGSFFWVGTMPEILDLFNGRTEYLTDLAVVNGVDPKLGYPYAFSVLTLPAVPKGAFPDAVKESFVVGQKGIANADPDWRIPYYMATNYFLELKDEKDALTYYDIAARTPGIPDYAKRFSLNFGIGSNQREKTKELWTTIRDSTNDDLTKVRAQAYIDRLNMFDYLEAAAAQYKKQYGVYPKSPDDLVTKNIISALPQDPFGFTFIINGDGKAAIDLTKLPPGFSSPQAQ